MGDAHFEGTGRKSGRRRAPSAACSEANDIVAGPDQVGEGLRWRMLETIKARPGISPVELKAAIPMGWGTFFHHMRHLEAQGAIQSQVSGRRRVLYPTDAASQANVPVLVAEALLRGRTAREVYEGIRARPGIDLADLCTILDRSPRSVYYHVLRFVERGLVRSQSSTRYVGLVAIPPAEARGTETSQQAIGGSLQPSLQPIGAMETLPRESVEADRSRQ